MEKWDIEKSLVISTGHITKADMENLTVTDPHPYPYTVKETDYGVMIYITEDMELPPREQSVEFITDFEYEDWMDEYSDEFMEILRIAKEQGCSWVHFDCDGTQYESLRLFDW